MKKLKYVYITLFSVFLSACSVVTPIVGDLALKVLTKKEKDFSQMSVSVIAVNNAEPIDKTVSSREMSRSWQTGANVVGVFTSNPTGIGVIAFDGTVTFDGEPGVVMAAQNFRFYDSDSFGLKTVKMVNADGDSIETSIAIPPSIRITNVNGFEENGEVDTTKPLTISLTYDPELEGKLATLALVSNTGVGSTMVYNVFATIVVQRQVTVPAAAFQNTQYAGSVTGGIMSGGGSGMKFLQGDSYLQIKVQQIEQPDENHGFVNYRHQRDSYSTVPVVVSEQPQVFAYKSVSDSKKYSDGREYKYFARTNNGYIAVPLSLVGTRIGIASLGVAATLYKQTETTSSKDNLIDGTRTITTVTTTFQFPQLDDIYWNQYLQNVHDDISQTLQSIGADVVPTDQITSHPVYEEYFDVSEANTEFLLRKNYRDTKRLVPTTISEQFGTDQGVHFFPETSRDGRLLKGVGMDAYLSVTINFEIGGQNGNVVLVPWLNFSFIGEKQLKNGETQQFILGSINGPGIPFSEGDFEDVNGLDRAGQRQRIAEIFDILIKELDEHQKNMGIHEVWTLTR